MFNFEMAGAGVRRIGGAGDSRHVQWTSEPGTTRFRKEEEFRRAGFWKNEKSVLRRNIKFNDDVRQGKGVKYSALFPNAQTPLEAVGFNYVGPGISDGKFQDSVAYGTAKPTNRLDANARIHDTIYNFARGEDSNAILQRAADYRFIHETDKEKHFAAQASGAAVLGQTLSRSAGSVVSAITEPGIMKMADVVLEIGRTGFAATQLEDINRFYNTATWYVYEDLLHGETVSDELWTWVLNDENAKLVEDYHDSTPSGSRDYEGFYRKHSGFVDKVPEVDHDLNSKNVSFDAETILPNNYDSNSTTVTLNDEHPTPVGLGDQHSGIHGEFNECSGARLYNPIPFAFAGRRRRKTKKNESSLRWFM